MNPSSEQELILHNYEEVNTQIKETCSKCNRDHREIKLIVVSKFQSAEKIRWLLEAGHRDFGESRVQEMEQKWEKLLSDYPDARLHYIGELQSRKIKTIIRLCHMIHSLDRIEHAEKIAAECSRQNKIVNCLIQINPAAESQKGGIDAEFLANFLDACKKIQPLSIRGLMCLPPVDQDPIPYFQLMQILKQNFKLDELSMGMSDDYLKAICCGATMLRIGTKIMGQR